MTKMIMMTVMITAIIKEKIKKKEEEVSGFAARPLIERKKEKYECIHEMM